MRYGEGSEREEPSTSDGRAAAGAAAAGWATGAGAGWPAAFGSADGFAAGTEAPPPSFLKREGASSAMASVGWRVRARASRTSWVSGMLGSGTQQSTGQTAAQASWSWKP